MSQITSHILDIARGKPAAKVKITLSQLKGEEFNEIGSGLTNEDGRVPGLCKEGEVLNAGTYRMRFDTQSYFEALGDPIFYPWADVIFNITGDGQHYHVPLLLSPFGHSTYRGS